MKIYHYRLYHLLILGVMLNAGCRSANLGWRSTGKSPIGYLPSVPQQETAIVPESEQSKKLVAADVAGVPFCSASLSKVLPEPSGAANSSAAISDQPPVVGMSLSDLSATAVSQNPDLVTLRQSERVSMAAKGVAETYPFNPFLQVQATPFQDAGNGGPNNMYHYVLLMQTIQLAHQQDFREQGARFALNSTRWSIHHAELQTLAQAQRLYFTALYLRGIRTLAETSHENNLQLLSILENQLDAGAATAADVAIVRVDTASTRQQQQLASANFRNALRDLARHVGIQPGTLPDIAGDLHQFEWLLPNVSPQQASSAVNELNEDEWNHAVNNSTSNVVGWAMSRPDVMAARSDVDVTRANLGLASAAKTPDLQVGPYYQSTADSTTFLGFRAQMDLPVVNNGEPLERQRLAEHHQRITAWNQAQRRAELEATAAMDRYATALAVVKSDDVDVAASDLPTELKGLEKEFAAGEVDVVRVVQARTSLILNRRARLDLLNELSQAAATLVGATGIPIENIVRLDQHAE
ncbi:MAG: TolC family protein [Planctomycetales bacterium]|nr:TolC family protein [Planctomycetales bacterium]